MSGVKVIDLPRGISVKEIKIYFSKPENGGGKVKQIYYPLHGDAAVVLFEENYVADMVVSQKPNGLLRKAMIEKLQVPQMYTTLVADLDTPIAEFLQATPEVLDELQFGSDLIYSHDKRRNISTLVGNWYQLEWAWKHVEDMMQQQSSAHKHLADRQASRDRQQYIDTDETETEQQQRETIRGKADNPIISIPASEAAGKSKTHRVQHSRDDEQLDRSDESEEEERGVDQRGRNRSEALGKPGLQSATSAKDTSTARRQIPEGADVSDADVRVRGSAKLTEILNDKPDDPRSLDFRHGPIHVSIYTGNITLSETDAITNAANEFLTHAGGVAFAIASAASPKMADECTKHINENGYLRVADVMHTCAGGRLSPTVKHIIHAVGPFWSRADEGYNSRSAYQLTRTFLNVMTYANKHLKIKSVTMPLISSGVFGGSVEGCVKAFFDAVLIFVREHCGGATYLQEVHLINNSSEGTVATVTQTREFLSQDVDKLADTAVQEFDKMALEEDVVRRKAPASRGTDYSSSVRMDRHLSMPSTLRGADLSSSLRGDSYYTPSSSGLRGADRSQSERLKEESSGPTSLGTIGTRSRSSDDDNLDFSTGDSRFSSTDRNKLLLRSLSSGQSSTLGSSAKPHLLTQDKYGHMTSSSHPGDKTSTSQITSGSRATGPSSGLGNTSGRLYQHSSRPGVQVSSESRTTITSSDRGHISGRPLPTTPDSGSVSGRYSK